MLWVAEDTRVVALPVLVHRIPVMCWIVTYAAWRFPVYLCSIITWKAQDICERSSHKWPTSKWRPPGCNSSKTKGKSVVKFVGSPSTLRINYKPIWRDISIKSAVTNVALILMLWPSHLHPLRPQLHPQSARPPDHRCPQNTTNPRFWAYRHPSYLRPIISLCLRPWKAIINNLAFWVSIQPRPLWRPLMHCAAFCHCLCPKLIRMWWPRVGLTAIKRSKVKIWWRPKSERLQGLRLKKGEILPLSLMKLQVKKIFFPLADIICTKTFLTYRRWLQSEQKRASNQSSFGRD